MVVVVVVVVVAVAVAVAIGTMGGTHGKNRKMVQREGNLEKLLRKTQE